MSRRADRRLAELIVALRRQRPAGPDRRARLRAGQGGARRGRSPKRPTGRRQVRRPDGLRRPPQARAGAARGPRHARLRPALVRRAGARARRAPRARIALPDRSRRTLMDGVDPTRSGGTCSRGPRDRRDRQRAHDQLDGRAVPDAGLGRARPSASSSRTRRSSRCGRRSRTSAGSTSPIRSRPGRQRLDRLDRGRRELDALRLDALHFEGPGPT